VLRGLAVLIGLFGSVGLTQPLTPQQLTEAIAIGRQCQAPIIRESSARGDFEVYIESPFARAALVAATARVMSQPLDAPGVKKAIQGGYRIWFARTPMAPSPVTVTRVLVRSPAGEIAPVARRDERLFLGTVPSHGIIEPLRARFPEYVFDQLPSGPFVVVAATNRGVERFRVTPHNRSALLRVCN
jgi:hypothetical protein